MFENGARVRVQVRRLLPLGLLVDLPDGLVGLIRERELAWEHDPQQHWREHFKSGDVFEAVPLGRGTNGRVELSLRLAQHDPWPDAAHRYQSGQIVDGVVQNVRSYGVFIEIERGIVGLLPRFLLPPWAEQDLHELFWPGDHVRVAVESIDPVRRRLRLSLMRAFQHRWEAPTVAPMPIKQETATSKQQVIELLISQLRPQSVLVVDDDEVQRNATSRWLERAGQRVTTAPSAEEGLARFEQVRPDLVLMDLGLPGIDGIQAIEEIRCRRPEVRAAIMTDWAHAESRMDELAVLRAEGVGLLLKPWLPQDLLSIVVGDNGVRDTAHKRTSSQPASSVERGDVSGLLGNQIAVAPTLDHLHRLTRALKVVLFSLDPDQRIVSIEAESGPGQLRQEAVDALIHSPVRDAAEEREFVWVEDALQEEARLRYLLPLLPFLACLGVPVGSGLAHKYALFIFYARPDALTEVQKEYARAAALALSALLEGRELYTRALDIQRLALLGETSRELVHEINHQLQAIAFDLESLDIESKRIEHLAANVAINASAMASSHLKDIEYRTRRERGLVQGLQGRVDTLVRTAKVFRGLTAPGHQQMLLLEDVVDEVARLVRDTGELQRVRIEVEPPPTLYFTRSQAGHIYQVLLNVILNAIQQMTRLRPVEGGKVRIRLGKELRAGKTMLLVRVEDDGPGIHRRLWERIFHLGYTTRGVEGSGLGLYITRTLAQAMSGRVYVESSYVLWGSTFVVELPLAL